MYGFIWLIAIVVFVLLEAASYQLICIWFAGGAIGSLIAFGLGADLTIQVFTFFIVSIALLLSTRPLVKKYIHGKQVKTNIDDLPGKTAVITEAIDNLAEKGKAKLNGMEWTARSVDGSKIEVGKTVIVSEISGVKLMVSEAQNQE